MIKRQIKKYFMSFGHLPGTGRKGSSTTVKVGFIRGGGRGSGGVSGGVSVGADVSMLV
jgi:hypothetical protein